MTKAARDSLSRAPGKAGVGTVPSTPGQPDMWILVLIEALTFFSYFVVYTYSYKANSVAFLEAQSHLNLLFGVINTLILLTSSWSIALAVEKSRNGNFSGAIANVWLTVGCGLTFLALKLYEWSLKIGEGLYFSSNEFFSFYYFLTGMHLLHVLVGFIVLGVAIYQLSSPRRRSQEIVETCATYWHMVDFLWVIIFALLYIMR
ncbi:cytochrome c oxidase subunit 3 [Sphingobium sufflavum]|uniref:cytochrome c oxidase subunit 3 n=1 Tax=Sphingobium sufflavum TaxID=1129547 RepID=UPI001F3FE425|nr:cytochrome c oxidase subunit 3 [Sphingobium sufflavum]MCE7796532.1 cytochrome c oxidase subunit 3 [Sphingobium sufflavum]